LQEGDTVTFMANSRPVDPKVLEEKVGKDSNYQTNNQLYDVTKIHVHNY
jgi:hypothetical protein